MKLTRGDLKAPVEEEHVGHVIGLTPLLVCQRAEDEETLMTGAPPWRDDPGW